MPEDIAVFDPIIDEGTESIQPVNEVEAEAKTPQQDSTDETKAEKSTEGETLTDKSAEGEKVSEEAKTDEKSVSDEETQKIQDDAEKRIADGTAPKWFKNYVENVAKPKLEKLGKELAVYEPLNDYGDVPKITEELEILKGLESFATNPTTNLPEPTVKPFVEKLIERKGIEKVMDVFLELGKQASPINKGWNFFHDLMSANKLDPTHLEDLQTFAANGYQTTNTAAADPDQLELIPENLREAFISFSPDKREELLLNSDEMRDEILANRQFKLDNERKTEADERTKLEQEQAEKVQKERDFYSAVNTKTDEYLTDSGAKLHTAFVESLVETGLDRFDVINIANTMAVVLNSTGIEGKVSKEALEEIGVKIDPSIASLYGEWQQKAYEAAAFEKQRDEAKKQGDTASEKDFESSYNIAQNRFRELETKLINKAKPIVAAISLHRANNVKKSVEARNSRLDSTLKPNNGIRSNEGAPSTVQTSNGQPKVFSEQDWERANPFD